MKKKPATTAINIPVFIDALYSAYCLNQKEVRSYLFNCAVDLKKMLKERDLKKFLVQLKGIFHFRKGDMQLQILIASFVQDFLSPCELENFLEQMQKVTKNIFTPHMKTILFKDLTHG